MKYIRLLFLLLLGLFLASHAPAPAQSAGLDWRFGIIEGYESPSEASNLGVSWTRVRFQWAEVQAGGPGTWTPSVSEAQINGEIGAGRMVVGLLIGVPDWARDANGLPSGLNLPFDDPNNTWGVFVRETVSRYNGRISHWIIWNEPDIGDASAPGHTWNGSVEDFFQLQRTAYLVAKSVNPNVTIHLPAFTYFWDPGYFNHFLDVVLADPSAAQNNYYFDVATAHLYFQPNTIYDIVQSFYGAMAGHGITDKGVWLVETNAPPINDPAWPVPNWTLSVTQDEQAAYIPQALASAMAAGVQRIAIYKLKDTADDRAANPEPFGLIRADGSRRPAFTTYQIAIRYMAGTESSRRERWNEVGQIKLTQGDQTTTVLFARLPAQQTAQVPATAPTAVLVDMWGKRQTVTAVNGFFTVTLAGALCSQPIGDYCMIGGTTYYLVQSATGGEAPAAPPGSGSGVAPSPVITATVTLTTPLATATLTPTATTAVTATPKPTRTPKPLATPTATPTNTATASPTATATQTPPVLTATPTATAVALPTTVPPLVEQTPANNLAGYWFLAAALLLGLGLVAFWFKNRTA